jgi:hypothetical protein
MTTPECFNRSGESVVGNDERGLAAGVSPDPLDIDGLQPASLYG